MEIKFIPLDYDAIEINEKLYVRIFGRTDKGERCCLFDHYETYFYAIPDNGKEDAIRKKMLEFKDRDIKLNKIEIIKKKFREEDVKALKIFIRKRDMGYFISQIKSINGIKHILGNDIHVITSYISDRDMSPLNWYKVKGKKLDESPLHRASQDTKLNCLCLEIIEIKQTDDKEFNPKVMAFDIESEEFEIGKGRIIMIGISSGKLKKVLTWKKSQHDASHLDFVEYVKDEDELIERFQEYVRKEDPDFLAGYFSDGFDMPYLRARADANKIKLKLGMADKQVKFERGAISSARIAGVVHVDMYKFISTIFAPILQSETLSLNEVSTELLGDSKLIIDWSSIHDDLERFYHYNLQDASLTEKLFLKLWDNLRELVQIIKEPIFDVSRDGYSQLVENYILHSLPRFNELPVAKPSHDNVVERRNRPKYEGAFVKQPEPGLYHDVAFFDFTSLYPSIIASFNISPLTLTKDCSDAHKTPEFELQGRKQHFCFTKKQGFIPLLVHEIIGLRKKIKKELKVNYYPALNARSYALKTIMNATYGYYGFFGARYYSVECAASIAAFARHYIKMVIEMANKDGFNVIYSDTDSVSFSLGSKTKKEMLEFQERINKALPGDMELELENLYKSGIFVSKRTIEAGAKKKYALIDDKGKLKIRGFETVRRDWCKLARNMQNNVIEMVLKDSSHNRALDYFKEIIEKLKKRDVARNELIIRTQLKKPISEYKSISPHVVIAQKMHDKGIAVKPGALIEYYIAAVHGKLVRDKAKMPDEKGDYDIDYYLYNQLIPSVENIFEIFGIELAEFSKGRVQKKLGDF